MPFTLNHPYVSRKLRLVVDSAGTDTVVVRCNDSARFRLRFPGRLIRGARASYNVRVFVADVGVNARPGAGRWQTQARTLNLTLKIRAPDGLEFSAENVTLADLARYRDARGVTQGEWSCNVTGQSAPHFVGEGDSQVTLGNSSLTISVREQVASKSAPALVSGLLGTSGTQNFAFDLFRIGTFSARVRPFIPFMSTPWRGTLRLKEPSGRVVASSATSRLDVAVTLATLDKSRGPAGQVLPWTLEVVTRSAGRAGSRVSAQVTASPRLRVATLQQRIDTLIGPGGNKLQVFGDNKGGQVLLRLKILDELSAETIDMHGLLDAAIRGNPQDAGVDTVHADVKVNQTYTLAQTSEGLGYGMRLIANQVKLKSLSVSVGASRRIQPSVPALRIGVVTEGNLLVRIGGFTLATVKVRGNRLDLELGFKLDANGTVVPEVWVADDFLDVDVHWTAAVAAGVISFGLLTLGAAGVAEIIEETKTNEFQEDLRDAVAGMAARIPQIMAVMLGDDFTYTGLRLDGDDIVFDHIAPLEPDPRPSAIYRGVVGRSVSQLGPDVWRIHPLQLGNTWAAQNLAKIDHVVVVMMENRSFDHVLGYRAQLPGGGSSNGLSNELLQFLQAQGYTLPRLAQSALTVKTQFPIGVGHELHDVAEQLEHRLTGPGSRPIVSPEGYVANFKTRHDKVSAADKARVKLHDVLGWYDGNDLPFYRYLAENYAWCEQYYCSHAGPTLPNRMFSLTGDVQYDRAGEAIVDNNDGDNFYLSRALTVYDLFTRKGLDWRVYESFPSATMLRMFARYATDDQHIVPVSRLAQDVAAGNLPPLTVIEPAMHHFPQNDDHPIADMLNGQAFLKGVYDTLRSNPALWRKTLLVITYDEHGGFYDHAVPPIADLRDVRQIDRVDPGTVRARVAPSSQVGRLATAVAIDTSSVAARQAGATLALDEALRAGQASAVLDAAARAGVTPASRLDVLTPYGVRVPTFLVSPWVPAGKGPDTVLDHCSILKTILARFIGPSAPFMSDRVAASRSFEGFLSAGAPRLNVAPAPAAKAVQRGKRKPGQRIVTEPMSRAAMRRGNVDYHDLTGWLARQLGR
jgi:phospholipase C